MSEIYNFDYYHNYSGGLIAYEDPEHWVEFFGGIADHILSDLHPRTVLDAGCAMGYLVAALRDRGVEAYGIDISEYAISKVREDIRPYCAVSSLTDPLPDSFPSKYDMVVTIEVLEHLYTEEGERAIKNLCTFSDQILFSSTPDDFQEHTHFNIQQREYWARLFAKNSFFDDLTYRPTYITYYAVCYRRKTDFLRQIEDYERNIRMTENEYIKSRREWEKALEDKERHIQNIESANHTLEVQKAEQEAKFRVELEQVHSAFQMEREQMQRAFQAEREQIRNSSQTEYKKTQSIFQRKYRQIQIILQKKELIVKKEKNKNGVLYEINRQFSLRSKELHTELTHYQTHYHAAICQREELKRQLVELQAAYNEISNAFFWKITKPFRLLLDNIKRPFRGNRYGRLINKGFHCLCEKGFQYTWKKIQDKIHHQQDFSAANRTLCSQKDLEAQRKVQFSKDIKFSILVPLYNTPERFLHEMIQSVIDQTYIKWELCLADGSDREHDNIKKICQSYARKDSRILYRKLKKNLGISENTNVCVEMASGDYIGLLDHDDLLHPSVLYEVMKVICEQDADFIYTDENTFYHTVNDAFCPNFKPDFAPDTLRSYNYICHFIAFQVSLFSQVGKKFRREFDGSQDYDLILRLTERAKRIVHIPKILYYWRAHKNSVAEDIGAKPYVLEAAKKAIQEHLNRGGLKGEVLDSIIPSTYRIKYQINGAPLISIIIPNKDHIEDLRKCITSIVSKSSYENYEVIIIENNSQESSTFQFYRSLESDCRIKVVTWTGDFNYSVINNDGINRFAKGDYILLLNNDTEVISKDWMQEMLMFAQRRDVGAVGAMLYYPDDTIQHAGVILGLGGVAGHSHKHFKRGIPGYMYRARIVQDLTAVTAACMMLRRDVWNEIDGLDEGFTVAFNDVDLCMRIRKAGYLIVWTPYAELYHFESKSRGCEDTPEKQKRFEGEILRFQSRWAKELAAGDPYYNPNLTLDKEDFSIDI